jgi:hypothetical protein
MLYEEKIKVQTIQGYLENKHKIQTKIKALEETIHLLENNDFSLLDIHNNSITINNNSLTGGKDKIEEIKKNEKLKNLRKEISILEDKIKFIDVEIRTMQNIEQEKKRNFDIKNFQQNFEKDKKEVEEKEIIWRRDQILRIKKFEVEQERIKEKFLEKLENEEMENNQKKQDKYLEQLEKLKQKNEALRESKEVYQERLRESKENPIDLTKLIYKLNEENFKQKEKLEKEEYKTKMIEELAKLKNIKKRISLKEIEEYKKNYEETQKKRQYEVEKEKLLKKEELMKKNALLPKSNSKLYGKIAEEEKKIRIIKEKEKMDKVYTAMKIKQFSKIVLKTIVPKIDEEKRTELQEKISKSQQIRPEKIGKSKSERIILKKPDPDKPNKYKWEPKLDPIDEINNSNNYKNKNRNNNNINNNNKERNKSVYFNTYGNEENINSNLNELNSDTISKYKAIERGKSTSPKRIPLLKNPDYLTNKRKEREKINQENEDEESKNINFDLILSYLFLFVFILSYFI